MNLDPDQCGCPELLLWQQQQLFLYFRKLKRLLFCIEVDDVLRQRVLDLFKLGDEVKDALPAIKITSARVEKIELLV